MLAIANRDRRTLTTAEEQGFHAHLETCEECRALAASLDPAEARGVASHHEAELDESKDWRWIARLPDDAFADPNALVLPTVDPIVFDLDIELAAGGMGRITKATDRRLGREVALKEVLEPNMRARFEREALITARLQHPAIVPIYEAGTFPNGSAFYTMRLVWGGTLGSAIHKTTTMAERLALLPHVIAVIDALAYAHSNNIIHRDLKPGNVLVGEFGETVVIDWGLAKELGTNLDPVIPATTGRVSNPNLTRVGSVLGTPGFMSPEQASGGTIDERADVYALGAILYNLLAGMPPYWDKHSEAGSTQIIAIGLAEPPTPIGELAPEAPADLRMIVEKAMARAKDDRYRSAKEMAEELRRFAAGKLITREYTTRELIARWVKKHRTPVAITSIAAIALAIIAVFSIVNITRSRNAAEVAGAEAVRAQALAEAKQRDAEATAAELHEQQGLQKLVAGDSRGALVDLRASLIPTRPITPALRYLFAAASHDLQLQQVTMTSPGKAIAFDANHHAVTIDDGYIRTWNNGSTIREARLGEGHIEAAWFSPDARLVGFRRAGEVEIWEVEHGEKRFGSMVLDDGRLAFDRAGGRAVAFGGTRLRMVDLTLVGPDHRYAARDLPEAKAPITDLAIRGDRIAACEDDGTLEIWDVAKPAAHQALPNVRCTALSFLDPDHLVLATRAFALLRWRVGATTADATMSGHIAINAIAVNEQRKLIVTGDATGIVMWSWSGEARGESRDVQGGITKVLFTPQGDAVIGAGADDRVFVWDTASFHLRQAMPSGVGSIDGLAVDANGDHLAATGSVESHAWALPAGRLIQRAGATDTGREIERAVIAGELWLAATSHLPAGSGVLHVRRLDDPKREPNRDIPLPFPARDLRTSADGHLVVIIGPRGEIAWLDPTRDTQITRRAALLGNAKPTSDPRHLVETVTDHVLITETTTGRQVADLHLEEGRIAADISPDGTRAITLGRSTLHVWELATGRSTLLDDHVVEGHGYQPRFDPTGTRIVLYGGRDPAIVYVLATGEKHVLEGARSADGVAFSRDGTAIALGIGNTVQFWRTVADPASPTPPWAKPMFTATSTIKDAYALSDGLYATGSVDGTIRIWDEHGRSLDRLIGSQMGISHLEFGPGEAQLLGYSDDKVVSIWDVHLESPDRDQLLGGH